MDRSKALYQIVPKIINILFIVLFVYAATSKLLDFNNFQIQLGQSPLTSVFAKPLSYIVPFIELIIALALCTKTMRFWVLYTGYTIMIMFTTYIFIILNYSSYIPCSCGGVLEKLGWTEHLVFNILFTILAVLGLTLLNYQTRLNSKNNAL